MRELWIRWKSRTGGGACNWVAANALVAAMLGVHGGCASAPQQVPSLPENARSNAPLGAEQQQFTGKHAFKLSQQFSSCTGIFLAISEYVHNNDNALSAYYEDLSRGSSVASLSVASAFTDPTKARGFVENNDKRMTSYWKMIVLAEGMTDEAKGQLLECAELNSLQARLVEQARARAYGFSP